MIETIFLCYWLCSVVIVLSSMLKYPPRGHERDAGEWLIGLGFAWIIWPFAVADLCFYKPLGQEPHQKSDDSSSKG